MFFLITLALAETKCSKYFCYSSQMSINEWELTSFASGFNFSSYGKDNKEPLNLAPDWSDAKLISINLRFPSSDYEFKLTILDTVKYISQKSFYNVKNVEMELKFNDDITIEDNAFNGCTGLKSLQFTGSVKKIGDASFSNCINLESLSIINVERIGNNAFDRCKNLKGSLVISHLTKSIGDFAFSTCTSLTGDLTLPYSLTSIGNCAFAQCTSLDGIVTIASNLIILNSSMFTVCSNLKGILFSTNGIGEIGDSAFASCPNLSGSLVIPRNCK